MKLKVQFPLGSTSVDGGKSTREGPQIVLCGGFSDANLYLFSPTLVQVSEPAFRIVTET